VSNLDDVTYFLALTRNRSLVQAAEALGVSRMTVKRRIASIEAQVGSRLFDHTSDGWVMTSAGRAMVDRAERIEAIASELFSGNRDDTDVAGVVRIVTTDGFGHNVLPAWTAQVLADLPRVGMEVITTSRFQPFTGRDFDIAITVHRSDLTNMHTRVLTEYSLGLYASPAYLERRGMPSDTADLEKHDFVWFVESLHDLPELQFLRPIVPDPNIVAQFSTVNGQEAASAAGVGIGLLPLFSADRIPQLTRILEDEVSVTRTFYIAVRDASIRLPHVQAVVESLFRCVAKERGRFTGEQLLAAE
jgi:DNA-binding transcriptional LysR family regulator